MKTKIIALFALFTSIACTNNAQQITPVTSTETVSLLEKEKSIIILDVRTPEEFSAGHLNNAVNIDVHQPDALAQINKLDKNAKYLVYCRTKNRSGVVVNNMIQNGFKNVYQMTDGYSGWSSNGLPFTK
jgi:rhodanese-related sulfurtransferase